MKLIEISMATANFINGVDTGLYVKECLDEHASLYPSENDVILYPLGSHRTSWSPLAELESLADVPPLVKSLVPDGNLSNEFWNSSAQTFVEAALVHCFTAGLGNGELFRILVAADLEELREVFAETPAQQLVAPGNEKVFSAVRPIAYAASEYLQYLDPAAGAENGFSVRRHLHSDNPGHLFLSCQQHHRDVLKPLVVAVVDVAVRAALSLPPNHGLRVIFVVDGL